MMYSHLLSYVFLVGEEATLRLRPWPQACSSRESGHPLTHAPLTVVSLLNLSKTRNGKKRQRGDEEESRAVCVAGVQTEKGRAHSNF